MLKEYEDLLANVRHDGKFHSIRNLVQPNDPLVKETAAVLIKSSNFIAAAQDLVNEFTTYKDEIGDYWGYPMEVIAFRYGDCDDKAILLCSILRNYIRPEKVFCAIGTWNKNGKDEGHMWVTLEDSSGKSRVIESTAGSRDTTRGIYKVYALFNDEYTFATPQGLKEFGLLPLEEVASLYEKQLTMA